VFIKNYVPLRYCQHYWTRIHWESNSQTYRVRSCFKAIGTNVGHLAQDLSAGFNGLIHIHWQGAHIMLSSYEIPLIILSLHR
jgi:hypothetical protein